MHSSDRMPELLDETVQLTMTTLPEFGLYQGGAKFERIPERYKTLPLFYSSHFQALVEGMDFPMFIFEPVFREVYRVTRNDGVFLLNIGTLHVAKEGVGHGLFRLLGDKTMHSLYPYIVAETVLQTTEFSLERDLVWVKPNIGSSDRIVNNYEHFFLFTKQEDYKFVPARKRWHITAGFVLPMVELAKPGQPTPFDSKVTQHLLEAFTDQGDTVLDPLAGTGTLGAEAVRMGRNAVLYELDKSLEAVIRSKVGEQYFA